MNYYKATVLVYSLLLNFHFYYNYSILRINNDDELVHSCLQRILSSLFGVEETIVFILENETDTTLLPEIENPRTITIISKRSEMAFAFHYNYVIVTKDFNSVKETTKKLIRSPLWDTRSTPRGKFLVFMFSEDYLNETMEYFRQLDIIHLILVTQGKSLKVYKTSPFYQRGRCVSFRKEEITVPCNLITNLTFPKITTLSGCNIRLVDREDLIAVLQQPGRVYGMVIRGVKLFVEALKANLTFQQSRDIKESVYNHSEDDAILYFFLSRADSLYGDYDVSDYFLKERFMWILPKSAKVSGYKTMNSLFKTTFWMALLVIFLTTALVIWFTAKCVSNEMKFRSLQTCLLMILKFSCDGGANTLPNNRALRILIILYVLYFMQVSTLFHGKLISALTEPGHERPISTVEELSELELPIIVSEVGKRSALPIVEGPIRTKLCQKMIIADPYIMLERVMDVAYDGNITTVCIEALLRKVFPIVKGMVDVISHDTGMLPIECVITMRKGHYLYNVFNEVINRITESGWIDKLVLDFAAEVPLNRKGKTESEVILTLAHLYPIFLLWAVGLTISTLAFLAEKRKKTKNTFVCLP